MQTKQEFLSRLVKGEALFQMACEYQRKSGCLGDKCMALSLYIKAAGLGSAKALLSIGLLLRREPCLMGGTPEEGRRQMVRFFNKAGKRGCPEGYYRLFEEFAEGKHLPQNQAAAERYLQKAARQGCPLAMLVLGKRAISRGETEYGRHLLEMALQRGHPDACFYLAMYYATVRRNSPATLRYLREGGRMGSVKCLRKLAQIYDAGKYGLAPNKEYARQLVALSEAMHPEHPTPIPNFNKEFPLVRKWTVEAAH